MALRGGKGNARNSSSDNNVTPTVFAVAVLRGLGENPPRQEAIDVFVQWEAIEGGHWRNKAKYNPLNTTMPAPGAGNTGTQGNIKVYRNWLQGVDATVKTLKAPAYAGIRQAFKVGTKLQIAQALNSSPWNPAHNYPIDFLVSGTHRVTGISPGTAIGYGSAALSGGGPDVLGILGDAAAAASPVGPLIAAADAASSLIGDNPISSIGKFLSMILDPSQWGKILAETLAVLLRYVLGALYKYTILPPWHWSERAADDYANTNILGKNGNRALITVGFWGIGYGLLWGKADDSGVSLTNNKPRKTILGDSAQKALNLAKRKNLKKNTEEATPEKPIPSRSVVPLSETRRVSATRRRTVTIKPKETPTKPNEQSTGNNSPQTRTDETIPGAIGDGQVREVREIAS